MLKALPRVRTGKPCSRLPTELKNTQLCRFLSTKANTVNQLIPPGAHRGAAGPASDSANPTSNNFQVWISFEFQLWAASEHLKQQRLFLSEDKKTKQSDCIFS